MSMSHRSVSNKRVAEFQPYFGICEAVAKLFYPYAEVVLHDLRTRRIVEIWNCYTNRKAGDLSKLNNAADLFPKDQATLGPYEKALPSLGRTKSITTALRDKNGVLIGFLCINIDVSLLDKAVAVLSNFVRPDIGRAEPIYEIDVAQRVHYIVRDYALKVSKPVDRLIRAERLELVSLIERKGIFQAKNSVPIVSAAMCLSRAGIYNLLRELKRGGV